MPGPTPGPALASNRPGTGPDRRAARHRTHNGSRSNPAACRPASRRGLGRADDRQVLDHDLPAEPSPVRRMPSDRSAASPPPPRAPPGIRLRRLARPAARRRPMAGPSAREAIDPGPHQQAQIEDRHPIKRGHRGPPTARPPNHPMLCPPGGRGQWAPARGEQTANAYEIGGPGLASFGPGGLASSRPICRGFTPRRGRGGKSRSRRRARKSGRDRRGSNAGSSSSTRGRSARDRRGTRGRPEPVHRQIRLGLRAIARA